MKNEAVLKRKVSEHPHPLLFATISGAHLYGFPSEDSDYDLRGVHVLPLPDVIGLGVAQETIDKTTIEDGLELDLVTHDVKKFFGLMLKKNGYVLEQVHSPLVVHSTPEFEELRSIASGCVTKYHHHHYLGFAATQWKLFSKEAKPRVKPLLYVYRVLLTGIHLMKTGEIEANLLHLNDEAKLSFIDDLVKQKHEGPEKALLAEADLSFHEAQYNKLVSKLEQAAEATRLPDGPSSKEALNDLLVRVRLANR